MSLTIRPVDFAKDRLSLLELLKRNLPYVDHPARFEWLYLRNPAGPARAWFILDEDEIVGAASLFPVAMWLGHETMICGHVGDFAVDAAYRSLGPAVLLQKATFGPVDDGTMALCYDCPPHERGMSTFRRLKLEASCRMTRFARPLRANRIVQRILPFGSVVSGPIASAGNLVLRTLDIIPSGGSRLTIDMHEGPFGEEFSDLDNRVAGAGGQIRCRRYASDLDWRFRLNPLLRQRVLTARRLGELRGYAVILMDETSSNLIDVFGESAQTVVRLAQAAASYARREGASVIDASAVDGSEDGKRLKRAGFFPRAPGERVVAYTGRPIRDALNENDWRFLRIDVMA